MKTFLSIFIISLIGGLTYYSTKDNNSSKAASNYYSKVKNKGIN